MLDPQIKKKILDAYDGAKVDGNLYSRDKLDTFFRNFRSRFGPDELKQLEGRELLERMHGRGDNDSLAYWLEFKYDADEFPGTEFGGIGGGSAFKFGIFYRRGIDMWLASGPTPKGHEISVAEAIAVASKQRDQFLRGYELLEQLPVGADDAAYLKLQRQLEELAPDVGDSAWGHKYFYLMFPEKLDDFHSPIWQRFYLLKALQLPPPRDGRYVCAGRYVAMSREVDLPMHNFTCCLYDAVGPMHDYWRVEIVDPISRQNGWDLMRADKCIAVRWPELEDLSTVEPASLPQQAARFVTRVREGDLVLACEENRVFGIGRVDGPYSYEPTAEFRHRRPVEWLSLDPWMLPEANRPKSVVARLPKSAVNILEIERLLSNRPSEPPNPPGPSQRLTGTAGHIQSILERKSQVILYGPPGTGKTYWAERTARDLAAIAAFGKAYQAASEVEKRDIIGTDQRPGLVRWCCFHAGYGYEDFIEGYRPETVGGRLTFKRVTGIFKQLCADARDAADRRFYLIIDEINRGDIPRIFGELLTVLEKDKRDKRIVLPLSGEMFCVPPNVFLIGTMNTADRSISLLDAALRRRFGFVELMPDYSVLTEAAVKGIPLGPWLDALNRRICEQLGRDARNLQVGHAYLMHGEQPLKDFDHFKRVLRDDIVPLLAEYCYDRPAALQQILGKLLWNDATDSARNDLFDPAREDGLIDALLEPCQDLAALVPESTGELDSDDTEGAEDEAEGHPTP
jgi:5-methylcytosine-specific restriction enzyme B